MKGTLRDRMSIVPENEVRQFVGVVVSLEYFGPGSADRGTPTPACTIQAYVTAATRGAWLARAGVHVEVVQKLMRHSTITLTMDTNGHLFSGQESDAVARFPDMLPPPASSATGTVDDAAERRQLRQRLGSETLRTSASGCDEDGAGDDRTDDRNPLRLANISTALRNNAGRCEHAPPGTRTPDPLIKSQLADSVTGAGHKTYKSDNPNDSSYVSSPTQTNEDLQRLVDAWPTLSDAIKSTLLVIVDAGSSDRGER